MFSVGTGFVPGKLLLTSLSECGLNSSTKSNVVNSAKLSSDFVSPSTLNRFIVKNTQSQPVGLLGLHKTQAQIAESAVTDIFASVRKDWFGHPFHLLNGSPLPFALSLVFFFSALHLISVLRLTSISAFAHGF